MDFDCTNPHVLLYCFCLVYLSHLENTKRWIVCKVHGALHVPLLYCSKLKTIFIQLPAE